MSINQDKLGELLGTFVTDLGATIAAGSVVVGHRLGLYQRLADSPATAEQLARRTGTDPRYAAEWLRGQAASGYVSYDPATEEFSLTEEQAYALADPDGPLYLPGAFVLALGALRAESQITDAFRTGAGVTFGGKWQGIFSAKWRPRTVPPPRLRQLGRRKPAAWAGWRPAFNASRVPPAEINVLAVAGSGPPSRIDRFPDSHAECGEAWVLCGGRVEDS
jgi:hypothetical protein